MGRIVGMLVAACVAVAMTGAAAQPLAGERPLFGRVEISTLPFDPALTVRSATYTPSGKVLVQYARKDDRDPRLVELAVVDDDGRTMRPIFAQRLPDRPKDNGLRFMVFNDNRRIFLGDFVIECAPNIDACDRSTLYPVDFPPEVADGDHIAHRWSEIIVAPDNHRIAWTTLLANYSALVFVGELRREGARYTIADPKIISTLDPFGKDPAHPDGVLPAPTRGGEVKQFVQGGGAISMVGSGRRDLPASVVQNLVTGAVEAITDTPGYTETTIFSPDERLGITMTTRFSERTDPAILGLMPRPYPGSLNMGLSMFAYTYAVTGVRQARAGSIGPALIDIGASRTQENYLGANLSTDEDWVFRSPMSWHPGGGKAMWIEGHRGDDAVRIQIASLPDYRPAAAVPAQPMSRVIAGTASNMALVTGYARSSGSIDVKVYGRKTGYIGYRRTPQGLIEKSYVDFSDDGRETYSGSERLEANPRGRSTYTAKLTLTGPKPGAMDLRITFGPLGGRLPAQILFEPDATGAPSSRGYAEYAGRRLDASNLLP